MDVNIRVIKGVRDSFEKSLKIHIEAGWEMIGFSTEIKKDRTIYHGVLKTIVPKT